MYLFSTVWNRNVYIWDLENQKKQISQNANGQNLQIYKHICAEVSFSFINPYKKEDWKVNL